MMEEVAGEDQGASKFAGVSIADELEEAAKTDVTQGASITSRGMTPPRVSSAPSQVASPSAALPASLPSQLSTPQTTTSYGVTPPPPTTGFVPQTGVVSATPPKEFFTPASEAVSGAVSGPPTVTPTGAPSAAVAPATAPYVPPQQHTSPPGYVQSPYQASTSLDVGMDMSSQNEPLYTQGGASEETQRSGGGLFGWISNNTFVNKVVEKTKSSVETMITTLDPGMKEVIYSGGDMDIIVTSTKEVKVSAVRQAFQEVFGRADVQGMESQPNIAPQPVGHSAAIKGAEDRIDNLRHGGQIDERQVLVSVENFIAELTPDRWYDMGCVLLRDPSRDIELTTFTQATPLPAEYVLQAQDETPSDYNLRWSGLAITIGQVIQRQHPHINHADWHSHLAGVSRHYMIYSAAKALAFMYNQRLHARQL